MTPVVKLEKSVVSSLSLKIFHFIKSDSDCVSNSNSFNFELINRSRWACHLKDIVSNLLLFDTYNNCNTCRMVPSIVSPERIVWCDLDWISTLKSWVEVVISISWESSIHYWNIKIRVKTTWGSNRYLIVEVNTWISDCIINDKPIIVEGIKTFLGSCDSMNNRFIKVEFVMTSESLNSIRWLSFFSGSSNTDNVCATICVGTEVSHDFLTWLDDFWPSVV